MRPSATRCGTVAVSRLRSASEARQVRPLRSPTPIDAQTAFTGTVAPTGTDVLDAGKLAQWMTEHVYINNRSWANRTFCRF